MVSKIEGYGQKSGYSVIIRTLVRKSRYLYQRWAATARKGMDLRATLSTMFFSISRKLYLEYCFYTRKILGNCGGLLWDIK